MQTNNGDSEAQQSSSSKEKSNNVNESGNSNNTHKVTVPPPQVVAAVPGQPWMPMQYPAAAMVMQHGMIPAPPQYAPPHYMPYHHHIHHHPPLMPPPSPQHHGGGSNGENRTIWVGDLHIWMDEDYLRNCFASTGEDSNKRGHILYSFTCLRCHGTMTLSQDAVNLRLYKVQLNIVINLGSR